MAHRAIVPATAHKSMKRNSYFLLKLAKKLKSKGIDSRQSANLSSKITQCQVAWTLEKSGTTDGEYDFGQMCNAFRPPA